jgi:hypothetical protein
MPQSGPVEYPAEEIAKQQALRLAAQGMDAGLYVHPGDPYLGKAIEVADVYYQTPRAPGYHFQQQYTEGEPSPPRMLPGSLEDRIALELARREAYNPSEYATGRLDPRQAAYDAALREAERRVAQGQPIRRGRPR